MPAHAGQPDLELLRLYLTVVETGSIGAAARRLGITQPGASLGLRRLERQVGVDLLVRSPRGTRLTPSGAAVAEWARELLGSAERFSEAVGALRAHTDDELRIVASPTLADHIVPALLARLWQAAADLRVTLLVDSSAHILDLIRHDVADLGFVGIPCVPDDIASLRIGVDTLAVVVAGAHPWAAGDPVTASDLAGAPLILREPGSGSREVFDAALAACGLCCRPQAEVGSVAALTTAVRCGVGVGVVSRAAVRREIADGSLVTVAVSGLDLRRPVRALWDRGARLPAAAAALLSTAADRRPVEPRGSGGTVAGDVCTPAREPSASGKVIPTGTPSARPAHQSVGDRRVPINQPEHRGHDDRAVHGLGPAEVQPGEH